MGKNDSSKCRVAPMMHYMINNKNELREMLLMVNIDVPMSELLDENIYFGEKNQNGEKGEKPLKPSCDYLCKIIETLPDNSYAKNKIELASANSRADRIRKKLITDSKAREEAIVTIRNEYNILPEDYKGALYLEGASKPDVYIETNDYIIVIEGKWTEKAPTESTTYIKNRNQMVRHIHDALNYVRTNGKDKKVVGFYIVSQEFVDNCGKDITEEGFGKKLTNQFGINGEEENIKTAYKGYITWERLIKRFQNIKEMNGWKDKPE